MKNILLIGDIMVDEYINGVCDRISPEAPIPIFKYINSYLEMGGMGNVAKNLNSLNLNISCLCSFNEESKYGKFIINFCKQHNIKLYNIQHSLNTIVKQRYIIKNMQIFRSDIEAEIGLAYTPINYNDLLSCIDLIVISDYRKNTIPDKEYTYIIKLANKNNIPVFVDTKISDLSLFKNITLLKPNLNEFKKIIKNDIIFDINFKTTYIKYCKKLFKLYNIKQFLITLGENGVAYYNCEQDIYIYSPVIKNNIINVTGAGDVALSIFCYCFINNIEIKTSLNLINKACAIAISHENTYTITLNDLFAENKIIQLNTLVEILKTKQNKKIGFINGCFDCLHAGHMHSIKELKQYCDILIVGVNSDKSVKQLKGNNRPIQDQMTRCETLSCLSEIDYIIIFDDLNALQLVKNIHPDVIGKQGYDISNWPEAQYVQSYNGDVIFLTKYKSYSTSNLISKIRNE